MEDHDSEWCVKSMKHIGWNEVESFSMFCCFQGLCTPMSVPVQIIFKSNLQYHGCALKMHDDCLDSHSVYVHIAIGFLISYKYTF